MNYEVLPVFSKPVFVTKLVVSNEEKDIVIILLLMKIIVVQV